MTTPQIQNSDPRTLSQELTALREAMRAELQENVLPYWMNHVVDEQRGGFYGEVDLDGQPLPTANKACVLNTRILWTFAAAARVFGREDYRLMAERAFAYIRDFFLDNEHGGFFMDLDCDGRPVNDIKHTYAQAFGLYSLCEYYRLAPSPELLTLIQSLFRLLEDKTKDQSGLGYLEGFSRDWRPIGENRMADNNEPKSMNTHLHVMEAYAALYRVWPDALVGERLRELLTIFLDHIIGPDAHLRIFFDLQFNESPAARGIRSFGHDIEGAWLLQEAAELLGDESLIERFRELAVRMADATEREAVDKVGGLFLESTRFGSHVRTNKHWWPQAEALVGFMNAFEVSGDPRHWATVKLMWNFIDCHMIDHERGEWFTKVSRFGEPFLVEPPDDPSPYYRNDRKVDAWKCPYHNSRACLELIRRIDETLDKMGD